MRQPAVRSTAAGTSPTRNRRSNSYRAYLPASIGSDSERSPAARSFLPPDATRSRLAAVPGGGRCVVHGTPLSEARRVMGVIRAVQALCARGVDRRPRPARRCWRRSYRQAVRRRTRSAIRMKVMTSPRASARRQAERGRRRRRGREGEHQGARPVRGGDRRLAGGRLAVAGSLGGGQAGRRRFRPSAALERDHEAAVPQRPGQPRRQLRRRLGIRDRPDDGLHRRRAARSTRARRAAASGARPTNGGALDARSTAGLPRLPVGALATDPRNGSIMVGTGEANNASENQYGVGAYRLARGSEHLDAGRRLTSWTVPASTGSARSAGISTRRPATGCGAARSRPRTRHAWQLRAAAGSESEQLAVPHRRSSPTCIAVPGTSGRKILAVVGWAGYAGAPAVDPVQRLLRRHRRRRAASTGSRRPGDINPHDDRPDDVRVVAAAGCTRSCRTPSTDALVGAGRLRVEAAAARPGRGR